MLTAEGACGDTCAALSPRHRGRASLAGLPEVATAAGVSLILRLRPKQTKAVTDHEELADLAAEYRDGEGQDSGDRADHEHADHPAERAMFCRTILRLRLAR